MSKKDQSKNKNNDHTGNEKSINEAISKAEETILSGDISTIYQEIENTEKIISTNINRILIDIFNSFQVMSVKKNFVDYIKNYESNNITQSDINSLENRSNEYRNIELPNKWEEMKYKIKFTKNISHYKAWYEGLQRGRYRIVVTNVKEFIVKELIKKILNKLTQKFKDIDISYTGLITLLNSKSVVVEDIKKEFKIINQLSGIDKIKNDEIFTQFETYMIYYFYLNYDLQMEKEIANKILNELKNIELIEDKYNYLLKKKGDITNSIKNNDLKNEIKNIFDKLILLYNILNKKQEEKEKLTSKNEKKTTGNEPVSETIEFLNNVYNKIRKTDKIEQQLSKKLDKLSDSKKIDVISSLKFDSRFEKHFSDVEEDMYDKDWGRIIGAITLKTKKIEKEFGMHASEQYLQNMADKIASKIGEDAFIVKKIRNMRNNLIKIHTEGAKKLRYLKERLSQSKNSAEKIVELQKISKNTDFNGVFGSIRNMERILVRDKFNDIYKRVKKIPIDIQKILFEGIYDDLKSLFKYEPEIVEKVQRYIHEINNKINNSKQLLPKINESKIDTLKNFKDGNLPFIEISDILDLEYPETDKYNKEIIEKQLHDYDHKINSGEILSDDIELIKEEVRNDNSIFKIDESENAKELTKNADDFLKALEDDIKYAKKLEELKSKGNIKDFVSVIMNNKKDDFLETINALDNGFRSKNMNFEALAKNYFMAAKYTNNNETKTKLNEIVEVIRRIEKEIDPLLTLENKIAKLLDWVNNEYKDKDHIKEVINNQIKEYILMQGREGGLLRELLDGLDKSKNKIKYLKDMMNNIQYKHLIPTIKTLIENIEKEMEIPEEMINEEWINKQLEGKNEDQKLDWLKLRKHWQKYEKYNDFINNEIKNCETKLKTGEKKGIKVYTNIVELADFVLTLNGSGARQKFIKEQQELDPAADETLKVQRKLLFYLMSTGDDDPKKMIIDFANRVTLSIPEKQKMLKILKDASDIDKGSLKDILQIPDPDIAFAAVYILRLEDPIYKRIKYLENFKNANEGKIINYKETFEINDKIISDVINFLNKKKGLPSHEPEITKEVQEDTSNITESVPLNNHEEVLIKEAEEIIGESKDLNIEIEEDKNFSASDGDKYNESHEALIDLDSPSGEEMDEVTELIKNPLNLKENPDNFTAVQKNSIDIEEELIENFKKEPANSYKKETDVFTEEEVKEWSEGEVASIKTTEDLLKEQIIREEFKKSKEKNQEIIKKIEERAIKTKQEIMDKVRKKAHEIHEDKNKKTEDKITELLSFLTTCYPEAITTIISDTILPVFKDKDFDPEVYNLMQLINNAIFKPALYGKNVEEDLNFFNKKLSPDNMKNIKTILKKIIDLWNELSTKTEPQEMPVDKENKTAQSQLQGLSSILIHLSRISPEIILGEIEKKLLTSINDQSIKNALNIIHNNLKNIFNEEEFNLDEIKFMYVKLKFNDKDKKIFEELIHKIERFKKKKSGRETIKEKTRENPFPPKEQIIKEKQDSLSPVNTGESEESGDFFENEEEEIMSESDKINKEIGTVLSGLTNFIKPHAVILDVIRNKNLDEKDFDVNVRREIIDHLFQRGKIFTYDGSSYIGEGQINNIVKENIIPTPEKSIFLHKLNNFLSRFKTKEEIYNFLGVKSEDEFRKLNFNLDKYGVGREPLTHIVDNIDTSAKNKTDSKHSRPPKRLPRMKTKPIMVGEPDKQAAISNRKEKERNVENPVQNLYKEKIKKAKEKDKEKQVSLSEILKQNKKFINKTQKEILLEAEKHINKNLIRLIKTAKTKNDLESVYRNYFGSEEINKNNQLNLCFEIKKIANIIAKDKFLFSNLSFNIEKLKKIYDNRMKKFKK